MMDIFKVNNKDTRAKSLGSSRCLLANSVHTQSAITCSKLTIETLAQGVKYVQS